ncbi:MAG: hypothetical protein FJX29_01960 [Alphaproteobacteria bacterium]|nr:hypothetical protein [Alphaproteobacteria bacterium]
MTGKRDLEKEFDALAARAGLMIPPERRQAMLDGYRDLSVMIERLHRSRDAAQDTAHVYSPEILLHGRRRPA